jgi:hypothetical protein
MESNIKTTVEWFEELPPRLRDLARESCEPMRMIDKYKSLRGALSGAFVWQKSSKGFDFWFGVSRALGYNESLDKWEMELEMDELNGNNVGLAKQMLAEMEGENE